MKRTNEESNFLRTNETLSKVARVCNMKKTVNRKTHF